MHRIITLRAIVPFWFCAMLCWGKAAYGQYTVYGHVSDPDGQPLIGTHVSLVVSGQAKLFQTTVSNGEGGFTFEAVGEGIYILNASMVGFRTENSDTVVIDAGSSPNIRRNIVMRGSAAELQAVTIISRKEAIEIDNGKLVFHVAASPLSSGSSALDLLRKLPGVSIGQNDQIMLKGAAGINVMIDGKMTYLSEQQLVQLLRGMSGESISKIELLTTPGAEYDAAGNAGIIHFVTKKNLVAGYSLDIRTAVSKGKFWMNNQNVAGSYRGGKLNAFASFDYNTPHRFMESRNGNTIVQRERKVILDRKLETPTKINFYTFKANLDWQLARAHQLTLSYNGYIDDYVKDNALSRVRKYDAQGALTGITESTNYLEEPYHYDAANLGYVFAIDSTGKKLSADAHYISYRNFSDGILTTRYLSPGGETSGPGELLRVHQPGSVTIRSVKADLDLPFSGAMFKAGFKYADISNEANYQFDSLVNGAFVEAASMSNRFRYREQIAAGYTSLAGKWRNTRWEAGLRLESTYAKGLTREADINTKWRYTQLFPSLSLEQLIHADHKVDISVSRRISRPAYSSLNPVRWYYDQYFYYAGNPYLRPEMAWAYSAGYTFKERYVLTASHSKRRGYLSRRLVIEENSQAVISQSANLGNMRRFDLTLSAPLRLAAFWDLQLTAGVNHTRYPIPSLERDMLIGRWAANAMLSQRLKLAAGFHAELSATWNSSELWGIYQKQSIFFTDFGLKKSLFDQKIELRFAFSDFLRTNRYRGFSLTDYTDYHYDDLPDTRRFTLSVKYHFGGQWQPGQTRRIEEQDRL